MDCDYNPEVAKQKKLEKKLKSKDKKKNALTSTESTELPDEIKSNAEAFEKYIDEFYKYDFEDLIDDLPCRFKYSKVVPNSYGLTIDEVSVNGLTAMLAFLIRFKHSSNILNQTS